ARRRAIQLHSSRGVPQLRSAHGNRRVAAGAAALAEPAPCFMCAETLWTRCHRRLIAELLVARGHQVTHLIRPGRQEPHRLYDESEVRGGRLYLCGAEVA